MGVHIKFWCGLHSLGNACVGNVVMSYGHHACFWLCMHCSACWTCTGTKNGYCCIAGLSLDSAVRSNDMCCCC